VRSPGHRLIARGAPHTAQACSHWPCDVHSGVQRVNRRGDLGGRGVGGFGHALCECGWTGPHDETGAARRRSWRKHRPIA